MPKIVNCPNCFEEMEFVSVHKDSNLYNCFGCGYKCEVARSQKEKATKTIRLDSGIEVKIPADIVYSKCKGCPAKDIVWAVTKSGRNMPVRWDKVKGWICHFVDCKNANNLRKKKDD